MIKRYLVVALSLLAVFSFVPTANAMVMGSLNGSVWSELNPMTGGLGGGKLALQGVKISLVGGGCSPGVDCPMEITDANGNYNITGLRPGNYVVKATNVNGKTATIGTFNITAGVSTLNVTMSSTGFTVASGTTVAAATTASTAAAGTSSAAAAAATTGAVSATTAGIVAGTAAVGLGVSEVTNNNSNPVSGR